MRADLSAEAIRLGRVLVDLMPDEPEAVGLLALMLLTDARRAARTAPDGSMVRLSEQDRTLWNRDQIGEGHALVRACLRRNRPGPFQIQAAIAAVHADADDRTAHRLVADRGAVRPAVRVQPTAVVALNRAVAVGEHLGADAGLEALEAIDGEALTEYQPFHAARADLLGRAGRVSESRVAYDRAIELTTNPTERAFLEARRRSA